MKSFDLVVIGAGPGGYVAAIRAAQLGMKTAIVESHKMGGECLNYGCIPSKAMISAGHLVDRIRHASELGIKVGTPEIDLKKLVSWKGTIVSKLTGGVAGLLKANKVEVFHGTAAFDSRSDHSFVVSVDAGRDAYDNSTTQKTGVEKIQATRVLLATGSTAVEIPTFQSNARTILNSRQALDVEVLPKKIVVIGGGFIGLEIGTFYSNLGVQVSIVEGSEGLLPGTDRECVAVVEKRLKSRGVDVYLNSKALRVDEKKSGASVVIESTSGQQTLDCDWVLVTVGRKPRTQGLNLEKIGLATDARGFISVNARLETQVRGVYAIGDIVPGPMLAHKASKEGLVAVEGMLNPGVAMDVNALPWAVFVDPEIAVVGHSEVSAKEAGWDPVVGKFPFAANGRALTTGESDGFVKLVVDRRSDRVLGAHMVGPEVSNLVAEVALAIEMGATAQDLGRTVHAHPTLPESVMEAAEQVHGLAVHIFSPKKRSAEAQL